MCTDPFTVIMHVSTNQITIVKSFINLFCWAFQRANALCGPRENKLADLVNKIVRMNASKYISAISISSSVGALYYRTVESFKLTELILSCNYILLINKNEEL